MTSTKRDRDPSRAERKFKKRKLEEAIPDLPGEAGESDIQDASLSTVIGPENGRNKRKLGKSSDRGGEIENLGDGASPMDEGLSIKKTKKERKAERKAAEAARIAPKSESVALPVEDAAGSEEVPLEKPKRNDRNMERIRKGGNGKEVLEKTESKAARFIVFIGNLPFSATTESIQKHFAAVQPKSVRHLTKKEEPEISKGYAFLEFEGYDHMKACLKSFHHSMFDDGISPARKINVELTAGGGGNKQNRHQKIGEKNQKLNEQRMRRMHEDERAKLEKRDSAIGHSDIHPTRRARVADIS